MKKKTRTVSISEAKAQLSKLIDQASKGELFIIPKGGKPLVKVTAIDVLAQHRCGDWVSWRARSPFPRTSM
jgi:prevent-host-death family protein